MPKLNPLKLNPLQLKTLALLQELAKLDAYSTTNESGERMVDQLPHAHGDHFHLGDAVVLTRDASGLSNPSAYTALERKGLIRSEGARGIVLTADGIAYQTGVSDAILHRTDH